LLLVANYSSTNRGEKGTELPNEMSATYLILAKQPVYIYTHHKEGNNSKKIIIDFIVTLAFTL
jgi:hypothetical protein